MNTTVRQLDGWRVPRQLKRVVLALVIVLPLVLSLLLRRSLRGGAPAWILILVLVTVLALVPLSYFQLWLRKNEFLSLVTGPVLLATGTYREVFTFLNGSDGYEELVVAGKDLRRMYSRIVIQPGASPARFDFLGAQGPKNLGTLRAPDALELVVWARGDRVRALDLVLGDRSLQLDAQGSVVESGVGELA